MQGDGLLETAGENEMLTRVGARALYASHKS